MTRAKCILLLILTLPLFAGSASAASKADSVKGIWKGGKNNIGWTSFLEVGSTFLLYDDGREDGLILEKKEGVVLARKAGMDEIFARIVMPDDDNIIIEYLGRKQYFTRSSPEEMEAVFNPPLENLNGSYRNKRGSLVLELSDNGKNVVRNGVPLGVPMVSGGQMYFIKDDFVLIPIEEGQFNYLDVDVIGASPIRLTKFESSPPVSQTAPEQQESQRHQEAELLEPEAYLPLPLLPELSEEPEPEPKNPTEIIDLAALPPQENLGQQQEAVDRQQRAREGRRQPTFRRIDPSSEASNQSQENSGGARRQRNQSVGVALLDADPDMKVLSHRYGTYMRKLAEQLQQSLNREVLINPTYYARGQAKIFFTITADGSLGYYDTQYAKPGDSDYVRVTSERTLVSGGPFERPTPLMLDDPLFQRMSLTVNLY